jgi:hypothetical protein
MLTRLIAPSAPVTVDNQPAAQHLGEGSNRRPLGWGLVGVAERHPDGSFSTWSTAMAAGRPMRTRCSRLERSSLGDRRRASQEQKGPILRTS